LPSPAIVEETDEHIEQHGVDPHTTSDHIKHPREQEKVGSRKKYKANKVSLDPITLTEGDLHDIGDMVQDVTAEELQ